MPGHLHQSAPQIHTSIIRSQSDSSSPLSKHHPPAPDQSHTITDPTASLSHLNPQKSLRNVFPIDGIHGHFDQNTSPVPNRSYCHHCRPQERATLRRNDVSRTAICTSVPIFRPPQIGFENCGPQKLNLSTIPHPIYDHSFTITSLA
jgi:hypothetical protein